MNSSCKLSYARIAILYISMMLYREMPKLFAALYLLQLFISVSQYAIQAAPRLSEPKTGKETEIAKQLRIMADKIG